MAGRIPQSFINDLLARVDIVDVIDGRITLKKTGKNYQANCPFHDEKTPSFSVSPDKQFYYCFGCQASGTAITFLMEYEHLDFVAAVESLAQLAGVEVQREGGGPAPPKVDHQPLYDLMARANDAFKAALRDSEEAIAYLKGRGITGVIARDYGIGFAPEGWQFLGEQLSDAPAERLVEAGLQSQNERGRRYDRFRHRVMFPIRDTRGRVIAFGGRVLGSDEGPKYLNSPETPIFSKGKELYGLFEARQQLRRIDRLLIVEGYMDVIGLAQAGIGYGVATLGTSVSEAHLRSVFRYADEAICAFDGDNAGRQAAWRAMEAALGVLTEGKQLKFVFLPEGEDPDSLVRQHGREAFEALLNNATPGAEYFFQQLSDGLDLDSLDGRAKLAGLAEPLLKKVQPGILKDFMEARLRSLTGMARAEPHSQPARARTPSQAPENRESRLSEHLLTCLLQAPELAAALSSEQWQRLQSVSASPGLVALLTDLREHADSTTEEVLARAIGEPHERTWVRLAGRRQIFQGDAAAQEFLDGIDHYIAQCERAESRVLLRDLQSAPDSKEHLKRYVSQKTLIRPKTGQ